MSTSGHRLDRINAELKKHISEIISQLKDVRINALISVMNVETTMELTHAKVYISIYAPKDVQKSNFEALEHGKGFIKYELIHRLKDLRKIPDLTFVMDTTLEYSEKINRLIAGTKETKD